MASQQNAKWRMFFRMHSNCAGKAHGAWQGFIPSQIFGFEVAPLATWVDLPEELLKLAKDFALDPQVQL